MVESIILYTYHRRDYLNKNKQFFQIVFIYKIIPSVKLTISVNYIIVKNKIKDIFVLFR